MLKVFSYRIYMYVRIMYVHIYRLLEENEEDMGIDMSTDPLKSLAGELSGYMVHSIELDLPPALC